MARERGIKRSRETFEIGPAEGKGEEKTDDDEDYQGGNGRRAFKSIFLPSESVSPVLGTSLISAGESGQFIWRCVPNPFSHECVKQPTTTSSSSSSSSSGLNDPNQLRQEKNGQIY